MRRRLLLLGFLIILGTFLAGCDWFGNSTLPTNLTIPTTTIAPITTTTPPVVTTTTTVTTSPVVTFAVSFYNGETLIVTRIVPSSTVATPPDAPTKASTAEHQYTFAGWDVAFTNVMSNLAVHATYTETDREYVVTFFDDGGNVIGTDAVLYGGDAEAPTPPSRTGMTFRGWIGDFTGVTETRSITASYRLDALTALVLLTFGEEIPTDEEIDERIGMLKNMIGTELDSEVVTLLTAVFTLKNSFTAETLSGFVGWYNSAKTLGLTRDTVINIAVNFLVNQIDTEVDKFDITYYEGRIAELEAEETAQEAAMSDILGQAAAYCLLQEVGYRAGCQAFFDHSISDFHFSQTYYDLYNRTKYDQYEEYFDYYKWESLQYLVDTLNEIKVGISTEDQAFYETQLASMLAMFSPDEEAMYRPVLEAYIAWQDHYYEYIYPVQPEISGWVDTLGSPMINILFFDYIYVYQTHSDEIRYLGYQIEDVTREKEERAGEHEMFLIVQTYLANPLNLAKVRTLVGSAYDILDSVVLGIDEGTFNLIVGIANKTIDPMTLSLTPAAIADLVDKAAMMMTLIGSSVDQADVDNLSSMLDDFVVIYVNSTDYTALEKAAMITILQSAVDSYLLAFGDTYYEVVDLLNSLDTTKIEIIIAQLNILLEGNGGGTIETKYMEEEKPAFDGFGFDKVKAAAVLLDTVLYGGEFDVQAVIGYVLEGYFDIKFQFGNETLKADVQLLVQGKLDELLGLAHLIAGYDMSVLTAEQIANMVDFQSIVMWMAYGVGNGFETLMDGPDFGYTHEMFLNLIFNLFDNQMSTEKAEAIIGMFMESFAMDEESTYFTLLSVANVILQLQDVTSLDDFKLWYAKLAVLGFPKAVLADVAVDILVNFIAFKAVEVDYTAQIAYLQSEIDGYLDQIVARQLEISHAESDIIFLRAQLQSMIDGIPGETMKNLAIAAQAQMEIDISKELAVENARRAAYSIYGWEWYYWDNDNLNTLLNYQEQILWNTYAPMGNPGIVASIQTEYDNYWNGLGDDQRTKYSGIIYASYDRYYNRYVNFYPSLDAMSVLNPAMGEMIGSQMTNASQLISDYNRQLMYWPDEIGNWEHEIWWRQEEIQRMIEDQIMFTTFNTFFADPDNVTLVKDVVLIALDEFEYVLANVETMDVAFIQSLMNSENPMALLDLSAAGILGYVTDLSAFIKLFGTTIDAADDAKIILLAQKINAALINADPEMDAIQKAEMIAVWDAAIAEYYTKGNDTLVLLTNFLDSLTVESIQTIMDQITIIQNLGGLETEEANITRAIAMATIVMVIHSNPAINVDSIIALGLDAYFDFRYQFTFTDTAYIDAEILEFQLLILAITDTAGDVSLINGSIPLTQEQMDAVEAFHLAIEDLMAYLAVGPDPVV